MPRIMPGAMGSGNWVPPQGYVEGDALRAVRPGQGAGGGDQDGRGERPQAHDAPPDTPARKSEAVCARLLDLRQEIPDMRVRCPKLSERVKLNVKCCFLSIRWSVPRTMPCVDRLLALSIRGTCFPPIATTTPGRQRKSVNSCRRFIPASQPGTAWKIRTWRSGEKHERARRGTAPGACRGRSRPRPLGSARSSAPAGSISGR